MRKLRVTSVDADARFVICIEDETGEKFQIPADERLRSAARGDVTRLGQIQIEMESALRPRDIQSRIRSGATVEELVAASGLTVDRVHRFAHPVLLERARAAELIRAAHPMREDGPALATLEEAVIAALRARGINPNLSDWDAWKGDDGNWIGQLTWTAGHTQNHAHWRFCPGSQGGTAEPLDNSADELLHPTSGPSHPLHPVSDPVVSIAVDDDTTRTSKRTTEPELMSHLPHKLSTESSKPLPASEIKSEPKSSKRTRTKHRKPELPGWEEVLLGVRNTPNQ